MNGKERLRVLFILGVNLRNGAGTEHYALNLAKNRNIEKIELSIMQTDFIYKERITEEEVREHIKGASLFTFHSPYSIFGFIPLRAKNTGLKRSNGYLSNLTDLVLMVVPVCWHLFYEWTIVFFYKFVKQQVKFTKQFDVVYLFDNEFQILASRFGKTVLGSTHVLTTSGRFGKINPLVLSLIQRDLMYRKLSGFHVLRKNKKWLFNRRYDFNLEIGVNTNLFFPQYNDGTLQSARNRLLYVGQLEAWKGLPEVLSAWEMIKSTTLELTIVGQGSMGSVVENLKEIEYMKLVSDDFLPFVYRKADIFVFPSELEAFPLVVLEAISCGLRVIINENLREAFGKFSRFNNVTYVKNSPIEISAAIDECIKKGSLSDELKRDIYTFVQDNYDWSVISDRFFASLMKLDQKADYQS